MKKEQNNKNQYLSHSIWSGQKTADNTLISSFHSSYTILNMVKSRQEPTLKEIYYAAVNFTFEYS